MAELDEDGESIWDEDDDTGGELSILDEVPKVNLKVRQKYIDKYYEIARKYARKYGVPNDTVSEIFEKTSKEAADPDDVSVSQVTKEDSTQTDSPESNELLKNLYTMAGTQFVQMFYDMYMSPLNSDIEYRLGKVTGTKVNFQNVATKWEKRGVGFNGAQYDKFGRIDTTINFKMKNHIDGVDGIRGYDEYYVNWFFPPFNQSAFKVGGTIADFASKDLTQRVWNAQHQCWEINSEKDYTTYDIQNMKSCRPNPTYRLTAFKSVNDNIQWLQHIYENTTGIVSTYLTEWDLSLYIQEGLLEDAKRYPVVNLCYRIFDDNPMGWRDTRAFSFGNLNACLTKTPICGITPNTLRWRPEDYPLSAYWVQYDSVDRGDGLDEFYDVALNGHNGTALETFGYGAKEFKKLNIKDKVRFYDDVNAAYSGWISYDDMSMFQILYSSPEDGFNEIDMAHISEPLRRKSKDSNPKSNGLSLNDCINSMIEANYNMDPTLGYDTKEPRLLMDEKPKKIIGFRNRWVYYKKNSLTGEWEGCGADITTRYSNTHLYWQKPKKGWLFTPKWRFTWWKPFWGTAKKPSQLASANDLYGDDLGGENLGQKSSMEKMPVVNAGTNKYGTLERTANGFYKVPDVTAPESYADHFGVSQRSPALTGGPHGKYSSPRTVEGYFEEPNAFLRDIPRIDSTFEKSLDFSSHFVGNNGYYSYPCEETVKINPSRSPSYGLALLKKALDNSESIESNIKAHWEISKVDIQNTTLSPRPRFFGRIFSSIITFFAPWTSQYLASTKTTQVYRLKFIGPVAKKEQSFTEVLHRNVISRILPIHKWGRLGRTFDEISPTREHEYTSQSYSNHELEFVKKVFGITNYGGNTQLKSDWKDVYLFQNTSLKERTKEGPNIIFQVPVRVNSYKYVAVDNPYNYWWYHAFGFLSLLLWGDPYSRTQKYANYIEVDADFVQGQNANKFFPLFSGIKSTLSTFSNLGTDSSLSTDIPEETYRTVVASSPWVYEENAKDSPFAFVQDFLGQASNPNESTIFGFGWTTGFKAEGDENTPINNIKFKFNNKDADKPLNDTLLNIVSTSTFYKLSEDEAIYAKPCIVQNDVPWRVLIKNTLHQVAWLRQAKESFVDNVDFAEVLKIINSSVEPNILNASRAGKNEDVSYNYWISKAIQFFGQDKSKWTEKFDTLIEKYDGFNEQLGTKISKSVKLWTYKDFEDSYSYLNLILKDTPDVSEFMTAYLNVLYEYRKYFLNKRFNKVGGTMTAMKHLESTIPMMINTKTEPENKTLESVDTLPADLGTYEYPVSMYEVSNSNVQKIKAASGQIPALDKDKTKTLYIKVDYVDDSVAQEYISKLAAGEKINEGEHLIYIPNNAKWAKLPVNGLYQFLSKEWEKNDNIRVWNATCNKGSERPYDDTIKDCIFEITWCQKTDKLASKVLQGIDITVDGAKQKYSFRIPYVYSEEVKTESVPRIKFGVMNGVNLSKLQDVTAALALQEATPMDLICTTRNTDDYWKIQIPSSERPLTDGYKTKLKIKTYNPTPTPTIAQETLAGPVSFTIWPITEDQVDVTPGIGINMTSQAEQLRKTRTSIDTGAKHE